MLRVGLTGGIACGKSTVSEIFRELGYPVLDGDLVGHQMLERGDPAHDLVLEHLLANDSAAINPDGSINRPKLAALVFADKAKLARLNAILHPRISNKFDEWFAAQAKARGGAPPFAVVQAALLVEAGYKNHLDCLIVVNCTQNQQIERMAARGLKGRDALQRIESQMDQAERLRFADDVIDTSGTLADTRRQVHELARRLSELSASKSS